MEIDEEDWLAHYGILRKSGRYPWGSGGTQEERNRTFLNMTEELRSRGVSDVDIAKGFGITTTELRAARSIAKNAEKQANIAMAQRLKDKGYSNVAIGERMGLNESSVRALLAPGQKDRADVLEMTSNMLKDQVESKKYIDIGTGVERHLGISSTKLSVAVARLQEEGYTVHYLKVEQLGTGNMTSLKVLAGPGITSKEVYHNRDHIQQIASYSEDGGRSYDRILPPLSIASHRVAIRYAEQGGKDADGVIYVRPGVHDVALGGSHYAQVRIAVDGTHYLKGMAMYKDDLPEGVDLMFNTNKSNTGTKHDAMKKMADDPENPFGALIKRQIGETGSDGKKKLTSVMNLVNEEGDWEKWSKTLSSQMLSKQSPKLAAEQLKLASERKKNELDEIMALDNPAVRRKLLQAYADGVESASVHLKAAALPRQGSHVILPVESMKETEVYAPNFNDGERVVLVRYPHGGIFEIPELTVNNRNPEAKRLLGTNPRDAIGIHSKVAERLSGADFDGDTVLVIPNNDQKIKTSPALEGLKGFDPQRAYPGYEGMTKMSPHTKQVEMGVVSNLITDMTIRGATASELARAVRHSMVVIDAEKHGLNYKQSAIDNGISQLKRKYQAQPNGKAGASTIISRAGAEVRIPKRAPRSAEEGGPIDKQTGARVFVPTGESYVKNGKIIFKEEKSKQLAETNDAHTLSSGTPIEKIYADHSNTLKDLADLARKEMVNTPPIVYNREARIKYASEVDKLEADLNLALRNSPLERQAQILANAVVRQKIAANPDLEPADIKKLKARELTNARIRTGAGKHRIEITPAQWAAIQAGAITNHKLTQILNNADLDQIKELATPKNRPAMDAGTRSRAESMLNRGYTQAEVANHLGISVATLKRSLKKVDA